jgi:pimeloyl-ACP methyl ester carboxylesterase
MGDAQSGTGHTRRHGRRRWSAIVALAGCAATLFLSAGAAHASTLNMTGTWHANYHCETGWCTGEDFPATDVLTQAEGSSVVTGSNGIESISGTLSGNTLEYTSTTGGYVAGGILTVSADGLSWTGPVHDNNGTTGTYTATREATKAIVSGQVLDERDLPAPEVTVKVSGTSDEKTPVSETAVSSASGNYSIEVPPGEYTVTASGEAKDQNGGKLSIRKAPSAPNAPECDGSAKDATCTLHHLAIGEKAKANFTFTYCASSDRLPNGKPPTGCPIIFIPGFLGSRILCNSGELWTNIPSVDFADMRLERDGVTDAGAPGSCSATAGPVPGQEGVVSTAAGSDIYGAALAFLNRIEARAGYPQPEKGAYAFPFDWRKSPLITLGALDETVDSVLSKTGASRVVLMAHSMGGLVTQAYIADPSHANKVIRAVTLGTPYWGAPKSHTSLATSHSNEPAPELFGLDLFLNQKDLQIAARTMQGLYWLYPSANYGAWLKVEGPGYSGGFVGGSQIDPWVASLGGTRALVDNAQAGHAQYDGFKTNGVDYQVVVGIGTPTITAMKFSFNEFEPLQFVQVWFGSGDGTVPARSATQGAYEGSAPLGEDVPIHYVCHVGHVSLPGNATVQGRIEGFLIKGEPVNGTDECAYTGVETEWYVLPIPNHGAFASAAASSGATVVTAAGTMTLEQAFKQGIVQVIRNGYKWIVVTDSGHPATLNLSGKGVVFTTRSLTSAGKGLAKGSGPAHYYGPVNGAVTIDQAGLVKSKGKKLKAVRARRAPRTSTHITHRGRWFIVRLTTKPSAGIATYVKYGKGAAKRYRKPLKLTKAKLKALRFASVDRLGDWERTRRVASPH